MIDQYGEKFCFIYSLPRSGSTLLSIILNNHPDLYCPPEPWFLLKLNQLNKKGDINAIFDDDCATIAMNELISIKENLLAMRAFANSIYKGQLKRINKNIFIDKTPRYYHIIEVIDLVFPKAKAICLIRNPLDIAASFIETGKVSIDNLMGTILSPNSYDFSIGLYKLFSYFSQYKKNIFSLRYEDLCNHPEINLRDLCAFLNINYQSQMLNFVSQMEIISPFKSATMGDKKVINTDSIHTKSIGNWKLVFSKEETQKLLNLLGKKIFLDLGYSETIKELSELDLQFPGEEEAQERRNLIAQKRLDRRHFEELKDTNQKLSEYANQLQEQIRNKEKGIAYLSNQISSLTEQISQKDKIIIDLTEQITQKEKDDNPKKP
jgi:hypothetical protein